MSKSSRVRRKAKSPSDAKPFPPVSIAEQGVESLTLPKPFTYDEPKSARQQFHDFCNIAEARLRELALGKLLLVTGIASSLVAIQIRKNGGSFVPNLKPGRYGVEHTTNGNLLIKTKRIIDINTGTISIVFGIIRDEWPDGLNSCTLVQPDTKGRGPIQLLADGSEIPIEPTPGYRFYTPFFHIPGAGSAFITRGPDGEPEAIGPGPVHRPYLIGIMTMDRESLSEILRGFNDDWTNGPVFSRKNPATGSAAGGGTVTIPGMGGGLEQWC
jgi:hypothetical protein